MARALTFVSTAGGTSSAIASGDTSGSINNAEGSCQTGAIDHVYELRLPEPAALHIEVTSSVGNPIIYLRSTRCVDLGCADETGSANTETLDFATLPAGRYYLFLDTGPGNARLTYELRVVRTPQGSAILKDRAAPRRARARAGRSSGGSTRCPGSGRSR